MLENDIMSRLSVSRAGLKYVDNWIIYILTLLACLVLVTFGPRTYKYLTFSDFMYYFFSSIKSVLHDENIYELLFPFFDLCVSPLYHCDKILSV